MDDFEQWSVELTRAVKGVTEGTIVKLQKQLVFLTLGAAVEVVPGKFQRLTGLILLTPVDTGRARASWNVWVGSPEIEFPAPGKYSTPTPQNLTEGLSSLGPYQEVWITSSLPYIRVLEYGEYPNPPAGGEGLVAGGFSKQAPSGMVRVTYRLVSAVVAQL